jgi:hypothetical protein
MDRPHGLDDADTSRHDPAGGDGVGKDGKWWRRREKALGMVTYVVALLVGVVVWAVVKRRLRK